MNRWLQRLVDRSNDNTIGYAETPTEAVVFVKRKIGLAELQLKVEDPASPEWRPKDIVPEKIRTGLLTKKPAKVVELGEVTAQLKPDRKAYIPFQGGCEIHPLGANHVGTGGMVVNYYEWKGWALVGWLKSFVSLLQRTGQQPIVRQAILTNSHVANTDPLKPRNEVWINQPYGGRVVGETICSLPLGPFYDASLVRIDVDHNKEIIAVGATSKPRAPKIGEKAEKYGRTTHHTQGRVLYTGVTVNVNYGDSGHVQLKNSVILSRMSDRGDSGSVIVAESDRAPIALLFAGSSVATIATPLPEVLTALGAW